MGVVGVEFQEFGQIFDGRLVLFETESGSCPVVVGFLVVRVVFDDEGQVLDGAVELSVLCVGDSADHEGSGEPGCDVERAFEIGEGGIQVSATGECSPAMNQRIDIVGSAANHEVQIVDCCVILTRMVESNAAIETCPSRPGKEADRP